MTRVLVIDDHDPSRQNLVTALAKGGYEVVGEGANGKTAFALAAAITPEIVFMAVGLPDQDGISVARKMMQATPVPIVLLTSHYDAETIERAKRAGVMGYLIKPLREGELQPTIELAISHFKEFAALQKQNENLKKTLEARKIIERAKGLLMQRRGMSEAEAFSLIQRKSMELRKPMVEVAQAVILSQEVTKGRDE
ncbi:MAG TPA: response regulator [Methylomirabilota bacterium]|nr:response regulator [Methylomirabilota bacterium]